MFPGVRNLFTKYRELKKDDDTDIQQVLRDIEAQRQEEANRRAEWELQLEQKRNEEALRAAEAQKAEEAKRRAEIQKQIEALRKSKAQKRPAMSDDDFVKLYWSGDAKKVEEAITNGANVNAKDNDGMTALMREAEKGHTETVELLRRYGAKWGFSGLLFG